MKRLLKKPGRQILDGLKPFGMRRTKSLYGA
jgi:hypothetical protein